eukprot:scaffold3665_cov214-Alexandrium_tamarense.AAC.2
MELFDKGTLLNVDTSTPEGIQEAKELDVLNSGKIDFIASSYVLSAASLFTADHRGRSFTVLRHPVDTAASLFWTLKEMQPQLKTKYTLAKYVRQDFYPDNWMTRQLTGTLPHEELTPRHLDRAKNILSAKFFVGIEEQMEETLRQLQAFYGWEDKTGTGTCVADLLNSGDPRFTKTSRPKPPRSSPDWNTIAMKEKFDMELYYFGLELFSRQGMMVGVERQ